MYCTNKYLKKIFNTNRNIDILIVKEETSSYKISDSRNLRMEGIQ